MQHSIGTTKTVLPSKKSDIFNLARLPGRLNVEETAMLLGFQPHDIPVLISAKLIVPLGKPAPAAPKWFSSVEIDAMRENPEFLAKATRAVSTRWQEKNARKSKATQ